jgi:hypothetical protein
MSALQLRAIYQAWDRLTQSRQLSPFQRAGSGLSHFGIAASETFDINRPFDGKRRKPRV